MLTLFIVMLNRFAFITKQKSNTMTFTFYKYFIDIYLTFLKLYFVLVTLLCYSTANNKISSYI